MMKRSASAMWNGDLKTGKGTISTDSGVLSNTQYSFSTRFENGVGTNPEELIGAAHAGCFSMALSAQLGEAGLVAQSIRTQATVTLEKSGGGFEIPGEEGLRNQLVIDAAYRSIRSGQIEPVGE
jgi:osmotically inducible protein OsmC